MYLYLSHKKTKKQKLKRYIFKYQVYGKRVINF